MEGLFGSCLINLSLLLFGIECLLRDFADSEMWTSPSGSNLGSVLE